jgi:hypothetical protein
MRQWLAAGAAMALVVGAVACGDDKGSDAGGGDDFLGQLNSICEESTQELVEGNMQFAYATDPKEQAELAQAGQDARAEANEEIEALEPPEDDAKAFEDYVAAREDLLAAGEARVKAFESGDEAAIAKASEEASAAADAEDKAAAALGADLCDDELPAEDAQAAEDTLREFATTADPATSCSSDGLVTETMLEEYFGGVEKCEKDQQKLEENPDTLPEDVKVSEVTGVDGISATILFEDVGGKFDGQPSQASVYNLDGDWKLNSVTLAP